MNLNEYEKRLNLYEKDCRVENEKVKR